MHSPDPIGKEQPFGEVAAIPWNRTIVSQNGTTNEARPHIDPVTDYDRRFLIALLRALSVWCA
jgi:hypothetical protein